MCYACQQTWCTPVPVCNAPAASAGQALGSINDFNSRRVQEFVGVFASETWECFCLIRLICRQTLPAVCVGHKRGCQCQFATDMGLETWTSTGKCT